MLFELLGTKNVVPRATVGQTARELTSYIMDAAGLQELGGGGRKEEHLILDSMSGGKEGGEVCFLKINFKSSMQDQVCGPPF